MSDSEDSYGGYDLSEFTEEDFFRIDSELLRSNLNGPADAPPNLDAAPSLEIAIEADAEPDSEAGPSKTTATFSIQPSLDSPLRKFRKTGILSVTDIVSPAWCEVQFDYGLRQKRYLRPDQRPKSFATSSGKIIAVKQDIVQENFVVTTKGKDVHKALEREVKPEMVVVTPTTDEERWALRLINMIDGFLSLRALGIAREVPVFGIIQNQVVVGIIDELVRKPTVEGATSTGKRGTEYGQTTPRKRLRTPVPSKSEPFVQLVPITNLLTPPDPHPLDTSVPPTPPNDVDPLSSAYMLHILDTKTRSTDSLPPHEDTISSRLQLMLYHRLLSEILPFSPTGMFDFGGLWNVLKLDPKESFSFRFMQQAGLISEAGVDHPSSLKCLDNLVQAWYQHAFDLEVEGVAPTLELIYRTQPQRKSRWKRTLSERYSGSSGTGSQAGGDNLRSQEDRDLERAILASLSDMSHVGKSSSISLNRIDEGQKLTIQRQSQSDGGPTGENDQVVDASVAPGDHGTDVVTTAPRLAMPASRGSSRQMASSTLQRAITLPVVTDTSNAPDKAASDQVRIIGTKRFRVDNKMLDEYVGSVLRWWYGYRTPKGVNESDAKRCSSCEYCDGCEWRETKAMEARNKPRSHPGHSG